MKNRVKAKRAKLFDFSSASTKLEKSISLDLWGHQKLMYPFDPTNTLTKSLVFYRTTQLSATLKKFADPDNGANNERMEKTFEKFLSVHDHMRRFTKRELSLPDKYSRVQSSMRESDSILLRARAVVRQLLTPFSTEEWFTSCKNSKGSSIGVPYMDTSIERKMTYPLSATERVVPFFNMYLDFDPRFKIALDELNSSAAIPKKEMYNVVGGSKATTVPKDDSIDRMIAIEPTLNMFFQQGLMEMMYDRMKHCSLDVNSLPERHKKLARESSLSSHNATIDFSSASDCVSYDLMEWLLPPSWFKAIDICRSPTITINGEEVDLDIISTMGNAVTFPLETIVFWALGQAVRLHATGTNSTLPEWDHLKLVSVFGDDCILPTTLAKSFIATCESVGFIVNKEKSFYDYEGFRESCGGDYFHGYDVRPFHIKGPYNNKLSSSEAWIYICLNKILPKYISYFGDVSYVYDKSALRCLFNMLRTSGTAVKVVPSDFPDDSGLHDNGDLRRLLREYNVTISPLYMNKQGITKFNFLRFQYPERMKICDPLRYAVWLKKPSISMQTVDEEFSFYQRPKRKGGGYVVGVSRSSHWICSATYVA